MIADPVKNNKSDLRLMCKLPPFACTYQPQWICTMLNAATWIKGIVYKKILSSFTNPDVIANQSNLFSSQNTKDDNLKNVSVFLCL